MAHYLVAVNPLAKSFAGPEGANLPVRDGIKLGRNVASEDGYRFPASWGQISGTHCRLFFSEEDNTWKITDSSTNGTFVNDTRVKKSTSMALKDGDCIKLSQPPRDVVKYIFTRAESVVHESSAPGTATPANKRRMQNNVGDEARETDVSNKRLRSVLRATPPALPQTEANADVLRSLSQLQSSNQLLHEQNEGLQLRVSNLDAKLRESEAALQEYGNAAAFQDHDKGEHSSEAAELEQRIKDMEDLLATEKLVRQKAVQEVAKSQVEMEGLLSRVSNLLSDVEMLNAEKEGVKGLLSKSRNEASELRMELRQAVGRAEALEEELNITQRRLTTECEAVLAARKRAGQAEEQAAAARSFCEEIQKMHLAAKEEIKELTEAIEAERGRERGAKDCIALQHAHLEGLRMAFDHALEVENESHLKLLEVQRRMLVAAREYNDHVKDFCARSQVVMDAIGTEQIAQNATQICAAEVSAEEEAGADRLQAGDATMNSCGHSEPCSPVDLPLDHGAEDILEQKEHELAAPTPTVLLSADPDACNLHAVLSAHRRAPLEPCSQAQAPTPAGGLRTSMSPPTCPSFPIIVDGGPPSVGAVNASKQTCAPVQEVVAGGDDLEDPSLEDHISLTQGSCGPMFGDDENSAGEEPEDSIPDSHDENMSGNENSMLDSNLCGAGAGFKGVIDPLSAKKLAQAGTPNLSGKIAGTGQEHVLGSNPLVNINGLG